MYVLFIAFIEIVRKNLYQAFIDKLLVLIKVYQNVDLNKILNYFSKRHKIITELLNKSIYVLAKVSQFKIWNASFQISNFCDI